MYLVLVGEEKGEGVYFHFQDKVREAAFVLAGDSRTNSMVVVFYRNPSRIRNNAMYQQLLCTKN